MSFIKKIILIFIFLVIPTQVHSKTVYAHPIDNSDTYLYIENEIDGLEIPEDQMNTYVYMNWFLAGALVERDYNVTVEDINELVEYQPHFDQYVLDNLTITNDGVECIPTVLESPITEEQFSLSLGTRTIINYKCESKINDLSVLNTMQIDVFTTPTNFTEVYKGDELLHKVSLGTDNTEYTINYNEIKSTHRGDESYDMTEGYTKEQIESGMKVGNPEDIDINENINNPKKLNRISSLYDRIYNVLYKNRNESLLLIIAVSLLLGMLHTLEAGHSKAVLASIMINNNVSIKNGIYYSIVFTVTHVADIIIIGIILLIADQFFNVFTNFTIIQNIAVNILLLIAIYLFFKNLRSYMRQKNIDENKVRNEALDLDHSHVLLHNKNTEDLKHEHMHDHQHEHGHTHSHMHDTDHDNSKNHEHSQEYNANHTHSHNHNHGHEHHHHYHHHGETHTHEYNQEMSFREQLTIGFLTGLAPCLLGWSVFMIILSSNSIFMLFPVIIAFGLGIFLALILIVLLVGKLKEKAYKKADNFAKISPLISSILILVYAIVLILK